MRKSVVALGSIALLSGGLMLPSLAQQSGRKVTTQTVTETDEFVRAGSHVINKNHIAYIARSGDRSTVYFVGNAPPLYLADNADSLVAQLDPKDDPNLPQMPNGGRSPFDLDNPEPGLRQPKRVLPSPGTQPPIQTNPNAEHPITLPPPELREIKPIPGVPNCDDTVPPPTFLPPAKDRAR